MGIHAGNAIHVVDGGAQAGHNREVVLNQITPLVLTFNEAPNIRRTLEKLAWAQNILVLDSFSTDETPGIVRSFPQARVVQRPFDSFARQCNFGLEQITTEWVLSLDADYVLSAELIDEIKSLQPPSSVAGYSARFKYCVGGHSLRASLYPPRTVLYRRKMAQYRDEGHGHRVQMQGTVAALRGFIFHDDRKPLDRWIDGQKRYARLEAQHLLAASAAELNLADRLRKGIVPAPFLVLFYTLFVRGLVLDGWPGWFYAWQRTFAEVLLSLRLLEARMQMPEGKKKNESGKLKVEI
jgi:glycosyltransferase involved in cell wall biosynthesis